MARQAIERLKRQIAYEHPEPLTTTVLLLTESLGGVFVTILRQVRRLAITQPLTTLAFAVQIGFLVGRHHAQR